MAGNHVLYIINHWTPGTRCHQCFHSWSKKWAKVLLGHYFPFPFPFPFWDSILFFSFLFNQLRLIFLFFFKWIPNTSDFMADQALTRLWKYGLFIHMLHQPYQGHGPHATTERNSEKPAPSLHTPQHQPTSLAKGALKATPDTWGQRWDWDSLSWKSPTSEAFL